MPTTIIEPVPAGPFGPGFQVRAQTDFVGPLQPGTIWRIDIIADPPLENSFGAIDYPTNDHEIIVPWGKLPTTGKWAAPEGQIGFVDGGSAQLRVQLVGPDQQTMEQALQPIKIDTRTGVPLIVSDSASTQGGLTQQEHTWLDTTQQAVQRVLTDLTGAALSTPIGSVIAHPDMEFLDLDLAPFNLIGRGAIPPTGGLDPKSAYGLQLQVVQTPVGFGKRDGAVITWTQRIAQLVALHLIKTGPAEWVTEEVVLHLDTRLWLWQTPLPSRILYDVSPGCVVSATWVRARL